MIEPNNPTVASVAEHGTADAARTENGSAEAAAGDDSGYKNSKKVYISGKIHSDIRVPFREITLAPTKTMSGELEANEPVRVYDTSGPWGDADFHGDVEHGLPQLRAKWIRDRGDVEECEGRTVQPIDDGWLSEKHRTSNIERRTSKSQGGNGERRDSVFDVGRSVFSVSHKVLRAKSHPVTQLWYA